MANTLTGLIPTIYSDLDTISRELVGFIPAVGMDSSAERAALNQTISSPVVPAGAAEDTTAGAAPPANPDRTIAPISVTLSKARTVPFYFTGEETKGLSMNFGTSLRNSFIQALRTLVNEIEADLALAAKKGASRAYGTAGTTPFATAADMTDLAEVAKILDDNGCPTGDRQMVLNNTAVAALRAKQSNLFQSGSGLLVQGALAQLEGFYLHQSGGIVAHTKGTGSGYLLNLGAGYAVGSVSFVIDTGTGTLLAGDILTNTKTARDTNKYVIPANGTTTLVTINKPGNRVAWVDNDPLAVGNAYTGNFAFDRNALWLAMRAPAMPEGGDAADDAITIADPVTGLVFEVREYAQYHQRRYEVSAVWGAAAVKSEHIATLLG